jgi:peptide-methionine (R)-S-oxide reductase
MEHEIDFSYIRDGIFIGTNKCCESHFDEVLMDKEGISSDISLEEEKIDAPIGVRSYLWLPTPDNEPPSPDNLILGVSMIDNLVRLGEKVYVHCKNGHGRAPTLVAAYFVSKGYSPEKAEEMIKAKRPSIHLTESQKKALEGFSSEFRSSDNNGTAGIKKDEELPEELYRVARKQGTEAPFSGKYLDNHEHGMYKCAVCGTELFSSETKFDSGTGWPSFTDPANLEHVEIKKDKNGNMEVVCKTCGAHLGHLFYDGPKDKGGKRYCINSVCLDFEKR